MFPMMVFLAVVLGLVLRGMTWEERAKLGRAMLAHLRFLWNALTKAPSGSEPFQEALRARTRWALVTPAIVAANAAMFVFMLLGSGEIADPLTLVDWGGSVGPKTTNGEWWRLASAIFVHWGVLHLFADTAGLLQSGLLVERLVGRFAFGGVLAASGLLAGLWHLSAHPVSVSVGAAGPIFGLYGLLLASLVWGSIHRSPVTIPFAVLKGLWPGAAIFIAYHLLTEGVVSEAMQAGVVVGFASGMVLMRPVALRKPLARQVCAVLAVTVVLTVVSAVSLRGLADVAAEVARVMEIEERTARTYDNEVDRFKKGRLSARDLAELAELIASELQSASAVLSDLQNVPDEQQARLANASEYLRLRQESWRLRADGLREGRPQILQEADLAERAALAALQRAAPDSLTPAS